MNVSKTSLVVIEKDLKRIFTKCITQECHVVKLVQQITARIAMKKGAYWIELEDLMSLLEELWLSKPSQRIPLHRLLKDHQKSTYHLIGKIQVCKMSLFKN